MKRTIDILFDYNCKITFGVHHDYIGIHNNDDIQENEDEENKTISNYNIILGLYRGLQHKGISKDLIHNCFQTNRLDKLMHNKYTFNTSGYYEMFKEKNIKIGNTFYDLRSSEDEYDEIEEMELFDDDHCPNCNKIGYITNKNSLAFIQNIDNDCGCCGKMLCKYCSVPMLDENSEYCSHISFDCINNGFSPKFINEAINKKIYACKAFDKIKFGIKGNVSFNDVKELLNKCKFKCFVCDDTVLSAGWKPHCWYQMTLDRINNNLPHNKDNILISCYYCNCIEYITLVCNGENEYKVCNSGCHSEKKEKRNINKRELAFKDINKINSLKLP